METGLTTDLLTQKITPAQARAMNPLTLAWVGDSVFSNYIRRYLIAKGNANVNHLTKLSVKYVRAAAQADMLKAWQPLLTEEEADIVRRGRNTKSIPPKNADRMAYRYATGLEALCGYLTLIGDEERLVELIGVGIDSIRNA